MMQLETEADGRAPISGLSELRDRLARLDPGMNSFAILSRAEEAYLQTSAENDGFIIERRDGDFTRHFYAARRGARRPLKNQSWLIPKADRGQDRFSREEMLELFSSYWGGDNLLGSVAWVGMEMADPDAMGTKVLRGLRVVFWTVVALTFGALFLWLKLN
jgi:hypothetical protein